VTFGRPAFGGLALARALAALPPGVPEWRPDVDLEARQGRRVIEFTPDELAAGLYLQVAGRVEFEHIDFALDDGTVRSVDAFGEVRTPGLYQVAEFDGSRRVLWVRVLARALSRRAGLGLRLGAA